MSPTRHDEGGLLRDDLTAVVRRRMILITAAVIAVMATVWLQTIRQGVIEQEQRMWNAHARLLAEAIRPALLFHDHEMARAMLDRLLEAELHLRAVEVRRGGERFQSAGASVAWPTAIAQGGAMLRDDTSYACAPIRKGGAVLGSVCLAAEPTLYRTAIAGVTRSVLLAMLLAALLALWLARPLGRRATQPITALAGILRQAGAPQQRAERLEQAADRLARQQAHLPEEALPEVRLLLGESGRMMRLLAMHLRSAERHRRTLRLINTDLERQVAARTEAHRAARERAEQLAESRTRFLAHMSHEIRTPMNAIIGLLRLMQHDADRLPEGMRGHLRAVVQASEQLLHTVDEILDFTKIDADAMSINPAPFLIEAITTNLEALFGPRAAEKGLALRVGAPEEAPPLLGDAVRIEQILRNLVSNAIKFTERGFVRVTLDLQPAGEAWLLTATVEDSGIGIRKEDQQRLFEPFTQAESDDRRRFGGTGLGLTICQRLCALMGGRLTLQSSPGIGSRFTLTLPLEQAGEEPALQPKPSRPLPRDALRGRRVLVVEDDPINRRVLCALLERAGIACATAEEGREGVARAGGERFDLILMDMQMPEMDGMAATRMLRARPETAAIPIIGVTANVLPEERRRCLDAGMNDCLGKPIDEERLHAALLRWLDRTPQRSAPAGKRAQTTETGGETSDFDADALLARLGGDRELQQAVLREFLDRHRDSARRIERLIARREAQEAQALAHTLAGVTGTLGAAALAADARRLTIAIREGHPDLAQRAAGFCARLRDLVAAVERTAPIHQNGD